jgi:hypothetical protein
VSDRHGTVLSAGDPVLWYAEDIDGELEIPATVLAVVADGYLIQLDQYGPGSREWQLLHIAEAKAHLAEAIKAIKNSAQRERLETLKADLAELVDLLKDEIDMQEPFVVAGDGLRKIIGDD